MAIPFNEINEAALANLRVLVSRWIPGGHLEGVEYVVRNPRRQDNNEGSFKINTSTGVWTDFACHDIGGNDPVSLCAYINNMSMGDAALTIAKELNITVEKPKKSWSVIIPVPEYAPNPPREYIKKNKDAWTTHKIDTYYRYNTRKGELAGYTALIRYNDNTKDIIPITYWKSGTKSEWKFKSFNIPRPIYKLDKLLANKNATVLVVEGEKCADAAEKLFANTKKIIAISWLGGCKGVTSVKWSSLSGRKVIFWPDADTQEYKNPHERAGEVMDFVDQPGPSAMIKIYNMMKRKLKDARIVKPPDKYTDGWDIADAINDGWDIKKIFNFIKENVITFDELSQKPDKNSFRQPFQCLGYNSYSGTIMYYYLPIGTRKITAMSANGHTKMNMLSLAPVTYYEREYPAKNGADYISAANDCMRQCEMVGIYDPMRCRGRGAWYDNGRTVLHIGNKLIVDGKECNIDKIESYYIYEAEIPTELSIGFLDDYLSAEEAKKILEISELISWSNEISAKLFAGWLMLAPICGAIEWRPHIWITGESSTGKSWIQDNIVSVILSKMALGASANSTEAGIRQMLKNDSFPVIFDEIETEDADSYGRVQKIIELARQASSNKGSLIVKGSAGGRAVSYCIRSCFLFSSINPKLTQQADESRITVLKLVKRDDYEAGSKFDMLREYVINTFTEEYCRRFRARSIKMMPIIRENVVVFSSVMARALKSKRYGDQIGTLLAGAYALKHDDVISTQRASDWIVTIDWKTATDLPDKTDQERCLDTILQQIVRVDEGNKYESIGSLIKKAAKTVKSYDITEYTKDENIKRDSRDALRKVGITTIKTRDIESYNVAIAENHAILLKMLEKTPWHKGYRNVLMRLQGAKIRTATFSDGRRMSAIHIPYNVIFPEDLDEEIELEQI